MPHANYMLNKLIKWLQFVLVTGDFAVLLTAGMTVKMALLANLFSAMSCYIGLAIGIYVGQEADARFWIFAVAGGMFLYVALVDMVRILEIYALLTKRGIKMAGYIVAKFFFCIVKVHKNTKKRMRPISSHLDRTSLVHKGLLYGQKIAPKNFTFVKQRGKSRAGKMGPSFPFG